MATLEAIIAGARTYLRDKPRFFTAAVTSAGLSRTFKLPHGNIRQFGLFFGGEDGNNHFAIGTPDFAGFTATDQIFSYALDEAEGLLRIATPRTGGFDGAWQFNVEGYYFDWMNDADLFYLANNIVAEFSHNQTGWTLDGVSDTEEDTIALGTAVEACWALMLEFSRDVDINTPSGVPVPATQRFRQVQEMLLSRGGLADRYKTKASMLGLGLERIEIGNLRRTSRSTNRLVPVYRSREWDDRSIPQRIFTPIPDGGGTSNPPPGFERSATVQGFFDGSGGGSAIPNP